MPSALSSLFNSAFQIEFSNNFLSEFTPTFSIARIPISLRTRVERYRINHITSASSALSLL